MSARHSLFALVSIALLLLLITLTLGLHLNRLSGITNQLVVSYEALGQWVDIAETSLSDRLQLNQQADVIIGNLPETLGEKNSPADSFTFFLKNHPLDASALQNAEALESILIWELFECHRLQIYYSQIVNVLRGLMLAVLLFIALASYFMGRRAQDYRLAPFPETNPHPVLGLNYSGRVIYNNDATLATLNRLVPGSTDVLALLPDDLKTRLSGLKKQRQESDVWVQSMGGRIFRYQVQLLPSHDRIHIYGEDITEQEEIRARNTFIAFHDPVCLLANRQRFEQVVDELDDPSQCLTLIMTRVSGTSIVASNQGLAVYDQVARDLSMRLKSAYLSVDKGMNGRAIVIRFDLNLFGCLYFGELSVEQIRTLEQLMQEGVEAPFSSGKREYFFNLQSGLVTVQSSENSRQMMQMASIALTSIAGKEKLLQIYDSDIKAKLQDAEVMRQALRHAVALDELAMFYQPQQCLRTGRLVGYEALMRWRRKGEIISPGIFIPIAEKTGLIHSIGDWGLREVLKQSISWSECQSLEAGTLAYNVSAQEFSRKDFIESVKQALIDYPASPQTIQIELTESLLIDDEQAAIEKMHTLKSLGFTLAIDDFGTGYSSFSYLSRFPVDKLKIDRSFVVNMANGERDIAIVAAMVNVAHQLGIIVIAEGVETAEEKTALIDLDCDQIQGYFYGKPMSSAEATLFTSKQSEDL